MSWLSASIWSRLVPLRPIFGGAGLFKRWATKKSGGSTQNGRDSPGQRLGVKKFEGELVIPGNIILRQRGTQFHPGKNVGLGRDHTIYSLVEGHVKFSRELWKNGKVRRFISVAPLEERPAHVQLVGYRGAVPTDTPVTAAVSSSVVG